MDNSKLLLLKNLNVGYTKGKPVLTNFSLELGTNEVVGLIGLNGAGKTTFIKTLSGLIGSFQIETALWEGKAFSFRNNEFKKSRYTVFAEDHSFQYFTFREYISYVASLLFSVMQLLTVDAYMFYRPVSAKTLVKHSGKNGNVFLYLLRYLITNKNYLLNSFGLCVIAVFLPLMLGEFKGLNVMPLGFAILCLNTPICTLLSCDTDLEQAVRTLPGQASRFCSRYCFFIFFVNVIINSIYLITWQIRLGGVNNTEIITALLFALQSAILSVLLEWIYPIRKSELERKLQKKARKCRAIDTKPLGQSDNAGETRSGCNYD